MNTRKVLKQFLPYSKCLGKSAFVLFLIIIQIHLCPLFLLGGKNVEAKDSLPLQNLKYAEKQQEEDLMYQ